MPLVIKSDGRREPFDRNKIEHGMQAAVAKRPVSRDQVSQLALESRARDRRARASARSRSRDDRRARAAASCARSTRSPTSGSHRSIATSATSMASRRSSTRSAATTPAGTACRRYRTIDAAASGRDDRRASRPSRLASEHRRPRDSTATTVDPAVDAMHMARSPRARRAVPRSHAPNPIVGCVIVDAGGKVIAEGRARKARAPSTREADALAKLGGKAPGATLYVNLEPCMHHGRTPPCAPVVAASGVARVVIGTEDPIPGHGGGIESLRRAGISVGTRRSSRSATTRTCRS